MLDLSLFEGILLGCALGAVSPAVVSPRMIKLIDKGYGYNSNVPKLVLAGSSVDDIYVIVVFYAFLGLVKNNTFDVLSITLIPITIIGGILVGVLSGFVLCYIFNKIKMPTYLNIILMLILSFLLIIGEEVLKPYFDISALLAIMVMGMIVLFKYPIKAKKNLMDTISFGKCLKLFYLF